ncbi:Mov34-domain-containing protein [Athelia psychrophila]|uniref:Mov34-domain-containing protein n=1 Tax=Athelia psychrophila TaxID=1759441 RepID=A0A166J0B3_9AGAM|nr:Mov34-domain-containing protein [Fibularhizoctonia sp. CBS 109695]
MPRPSQHQVYPYGLPTPQQHIASPGYPGYPPPTRNAPPTPVSQHSSGPPHQEEFARITRPVDKTRADPVAKELKNVILPRECLHRFLSIASINTSLNRETCGLLLGKDKGHKYAVTTLLIPRQHSTSDTCTMDEEELVMQFTEERSLITLGWIHTHPSQSCFMSSVDLHTHSGFQRMLPESFAVVCAPKSDPPFGIFRLTDPPGLETILHCQDKEAFHPHPDVPIYTDADKGHIQVRDIPIEIVDLRP